ncbi:MAG: hypothetical protein GY865_08830 [candidate division Zixibacteria bacterium]|nr:hypothetical protein [candidate division Zixibacteria bacterium]
MHKKVILFRFSIITVLISYLIVAVLPLGALAQGAINCPYDKESPSLEHARQTFKGLNYNCAELEINDVLLDESLTLKEKADAHVLMAAVYYAKLKDVKEKRNKVIEQFAQAFRSYADWSGDVDIKSTEFLSMMDHAKTLVQTEIKTPDLDTLVTIPTLDSGNKKPWYTKWWAIGLGVGVVALVLVGGGGDSESAPDAPLGDFPDPPETGK